MDTPKQQYESIDMAKLPTRGKNLVGKLVEISDNFTDKQLMEAPGEGGARSWGEQWSATWQVIKKAYPEAIKPKESAKAKPKATPSAPKKNAKKTVKKTASHAPRGNTRKLAADTDMLAKIHRMNGKRYKYVTFKNKLKALQRLKTEKQYRKELAPLLTEVYKELLAVHNKMVEKDVEEAVFEIGKPTLSKIVAHIGKKEVYPATKLMARYINLQNKPFSATSTQRLLGAVRSELKKHPKVHKESLEEIAKTLECSIKNKKRVESPSEMLDGLGK